MDELYMLPKREEAIEEFLRLLEIDDDLEEDLKEYYDSEIRSVLPG